MQFFPHLLWFSNNNLIISLHIRSMWETICDAWACWSGWNFGPNSTVYPYSVEYPPPPPSPPPGNWNLGRSWHFKTFQFQNTPPQENCNFGRSWHFKTFQFQNIWYQWETMCGKLPHVETLSSPDNYSLWSLLLLLQILRSRLPFGGNFSNSRHHWNREIANRCLSGF